MINKIFVFTGLLFLTLICAYITGWFYFANQIDRQIIRFIDEQSMRGWIFDGDISNANGFPGVYKIVYTGKVIHPEGISAHFPTLEISGIPLEGQKITVKAPMGMKLEMPNLPDHLKKLENAAMTFVIPTKPPPEPTYPYLKVWQFEGNAKVDIPALTLQWPDASIYAEAELRLDENLQPEGEARLGITNHSFFLDLIAEQTGMPNSQKIMVLTFLNALDKTNGAVTLPFQITKNTLYLNMIRLGTIPFIYWPGSEFSGRVPLGNPPVRRQ